MKNYYLLLLILFIAWSCSPEKHKNSTAKAIPVKVKAIRSVQTYETLTYSGSIIPYKSVNVAFLVPGQIRSVEVNSGNYVGKGQLLATLDPADYQFALDAAQAQFERAKSEYDRLTALYEKGSLTQSELDKITSLYKEAKADLAYKEKQLQDTRLYSPAEGWLSYDIPEPGEVIKEGIPLFRIIHSKNVYVKFLVPEKEIKHMQLKDSIRFSLPAMTDSTLTAVIEEIAPDAEKFSRAYTVKAKIENEAFLLRPGMIAEARFTGKKALSRIRIPAASVLRDANGETYVYLAKDGKAHKQKISTGESSKGGVIVNSGLEATDSLIIKGQHKIYENARISLIQ